MRQTFLIGLALWLATALPLPSVAQSRADPGYLELSPPQPTSDPGSIVVTEFFSYQCPHCYSFFPALNEWANRLPDDVVFERVADSIGNSSWVPMTQAFYALQSMGRIDDLDADIFHAIHAEGIRLFDKASIADWVASQDIDKTAFVEVYDSFSVTTAVRSADRLSVTHRINSIPTIVVDGRFVVAIVDDGVFDSQLETVNRLIGRIRSERRQ
jgi:thiol:disulfide interchange protein DsbA